MSSGNLTTSPSIEQSYTLIVLPLANGLGVRAVQFEGVGASDLFLLTGVGGVIVECPPKGAKGEKSGSGRGAEKAGSGRGTEKAEGGLLNKTLVATMFAGPTD